MLFSNNNSTCQLCVVAIAEPVNSDGNATESVDPDSNDAMKEHGLLNRKAHININIDEHSVIYENEENTDIIHNLGQYRQLVQLVSYYN